MLLNLFRHYSWLGPVWISQLGLVAFLYSSLAHSYPIFGHVFSDHGGSLHSRKPPLKSSNQ